MFKNGLFSFTGRPMFVFSPEDAGVTPPETPATSTPPAADPKQEIPPETKPAKVEMTSEQLKDRLDRAKEADRKALFKELGVESADDLKAALEAKKQAELDKLSEKERLEKQLEEANRRADEALAMAQREAADRRKAEADTFIEREALANGVNREYLDVVQVKLQKFVAQQNLSDEDEVTEETLKPFFTDLKQKQPLLFQVTETPAATHTPSKEPQTPPSTPAGGSVDVSKLSPAEYRQWKRDSGYSF